MKVMNGKTRSVWPVLYTWKVCLNCITSVECLGNKEQVVSPTRRRPPECVMLVFVCKQRLPHNYDLGIQFHPFTSIIDEFSSFWRLEKTV